MEQFTKDKKRTAVVLLSLAASLSVYLCIVTMLDSQAARTIVSNYMDTDMVIQNDTVCKEKSEGRRDVLDESLVKSIKENAGVFEVHSMIFAEITVPWEPDFAEMWMKEFYAKWMSIPYGKEKDKYQNHPGNPKLKMQMRLKKHRAICRNWESVCWFVLWFQCLLGLFWKRMELLLRELRELSDIEATHHNGDTII